MTAANPLRLNPVQLPYGRRQENTTELSLPGPPPFEMLRVFRSGESEGGPLGKGHISTVDMHLRDGEDGGYDWIDMTLMPVHFDAPDPQPGATSTNDARKDLALEPLPRSGFLIRKGRTSYELTLFPGRVWYVSAIVELTGVRTLFERDRNGVLTAIRFPNGLSLEFLNHTTGLREGYDLVSPSGQRQPVMRYLYDSQNRLISADNEVGPSQRFDFDDGARQMFSFDAMGHRTTHQFDEKGRVVSVETGGSYKEGRIEYHDDRSQVSVHQREEGRFEKLWFDDHNRNFMASDPLGRISYKEYNSNHQLVSETDPNGNKTEYRYDGFGNVEAVKDGEGRETFAVWDEYGNNTVLKDPGGATWRATFDDYGRLSETTDPIGNITNFKTDRFGQATQIMRHDGLIEFRDYDDAGRLVAVRDFNSSQTQLFYDEFGRLVKTIDQLGHESTFAYEPMKGRDFFTPSRVRRADNVEVRRDTGPNGKVRSVTDGEGRKTIYRYGPYEMLEEITDPKGGTLNLNYDSQQRLFQVTNQLGLKWTFERDAAGNLVAETDFDNRTLRYAHDNAGRIVRRTNPDQSFIDYSYDKSGRLVEVVVRGPGQVAEWRTTFGYDDAGRLIEAENDHAKIELERDAIGRIIAETVDGNRIENDYDCCGNRTERRIEDQVIKLAYDGMGGLTQWALNDHIPLELTRDKKGQETGRTSQGFGLASIWDPVGQVTQQAGAEVERNYEWTSANEPKVINDRRWGDKRYDYNPNGQITRTFHGDGETEGFVYSADLNIAATTSGTKRFLDWQTSGSGIVKLSHGPRGEAVTLEHDLCGRVIRRTVARKGFRPQTWAFRWNGLDQLIEADCPDGTSWRYTYDPFGRRLTKEGAGTLHEFLWDKDVIARETVNGHPVDWFFEPDTFRPMARSEAGQLAYVVNDHLGTPKEIIAEDGSLLWAVDHDTWGTIRDNRVQAVGSEMTEEGDYWIGETDISTKQAATDYKSSPDAAYCPIRFQGQWEDAETGLFYNRFRIYDALATQYYSSDPIGLRGGLRPHAYVYAPNNSVDPSGLARTGEAGVVNGVLCIVNIYAPGGREENPFRSSDFEGFMELWDERAQAEPGGLTRRTVDEDERARADANNRTLRRCCSDLFPDRYTVVGHLPDMAWGGTAVPGPDGWVPLDSRVNNFIGVASGRVDVGTTYNSVRSVASMDDC